MMSLYLIGALFSFLTLIAIYTYAYHSDPDFFNTNDDIGFHFTIFIVGTIISWLLPIVLLVIWLVTKAVKKQEKDQS